MESQTVPLCVDEKNEKELEAGEYYKDEEKKSIVKNELFVKETQFCMTSPKEVNGANEAILSPEQKMEAEVAKDEGTLLESQVLDSISVLEVDSCNVGDISSEELVPQEVCGNDNKESGQPQNENLVFGGESSFSVEEIPDSAKLAPLVESKKEEHNSSSTSARSIQESEEVETKADLSDFNDVDDDQNLCDDIKKSLFSSQEFQENVATGLDVDDESFKKTSSENEDEDKCLHPNSELQSSNLIINGENGNEEKEAEEDEEEKINNEEVANETEVKAFMQQGVSTSVDLSQKKTPPMEKENLPNGDVGEMEKLDDSVAKKYLPAQFDKESEISKEEEEKLNTSETVKETRDLLLEEVVADNLLNVAISTGRELTPAGEDQVDADQGSVEVDFMVGEDDENDDGNGINADDEQEDDSESEAAAVEEDDIPEALILDAPEKSKDEDDKNTQEKERVLPITESLPTTSEMAKECQEIDTKPIDDFSLESHLPTNSEMSEDLQDIVTKTSDDESLKLTSGEDVEKLKNLNVKVDVLEASSSSNETESSEIKETESLYAMEEIPPGDTELKTDHDISKKIETIEVTQPPEATTAEITVERAVERSICEGEKVAQMQETISPVTAEESTVTEEKAGNEEEQSQLLVGKELTPEAESLLETDEIIATTKPLDKVEMKDQIDTKTSDILDQVVTSPKTMMEEIKEDEEVTLKKEMITSKDVLPEDKLEIKAIKCPTEEMKKEQLRLPLKSTTSKMAKDRSKPYKTSTRKETDNDSGVDETTQAKIETSPKKNTPSYLRRTTGRQQVTSPTKTYRLPSPSKPILSPTKQMASARVPAGAVSPGSKMSQNKTTPTGEQKKLPMNKIVVGLSASPNLKEVKSKVGSMANMTHRPGGGAVKVETKHTDYSQAKSKIGSVSNINHKPGGGVKKIESKKLEWNVGSKIGSLDNAHHKPGGGDKKIECVKLDFKDKAKPKVGSTANVKHEPGGGKVQIEDHKLNFKETAAPKIGSLDNVTHKPGGGEVKIFDEAAKSRSKSNVNGRLSGDQSPQSVSPGPPQNGLTPSSEEVIQEEVANMHV